MFGNSAIATLHYHVADFALAEVLKCAIRTESICVTVFETMLRLGPPSLLASGRIWFPSPWHDPVTGLMEPLQVWRSRPLRSQRSHWQIVRPWPQARGKRPSRYASESGEDRAVRRDAAMWFRWSQGGPRASGPDVFR